jgi:hypothetical protein
VEEPVFNGFVPVPVSIGPGRGFRPGKLRLRPVQGSTGLGSSQIQFL